MPITPNNPFKGRQHPGEVIVLCVRLYLRYPLSYEHVAELVAERGVEVLASCKRGGGLLRSGLLPGPAFHRRRTGAGRSLHVNRKCPVPKSCLGVGRCESSVPG